VWPPIFNEEIGGERVYENMVKYEVEGSQKNYIKMKNDIKMKNLNQKSF